MGGNDRDVDGNDDDDNDNKFFKLWRYYYLILDLTDAVARGVSTKLENRSATDFPNSFSIV